MATTLQLSIVTLGIVLLMWALLYGCARFVRNKERNVGTRCHYDDME